jgi:hypothetical protein
MRHFLSLITLLSLVLVGHSQTNLSTNTVTICSGQNVSVTASNPNSSYIFSWSSGTSTQTVSTLSLTNVQVSQTWVCTTFDGTNLVETDNLTITVNQTPTITSSLNLTVCSGNSLNYNITSSTPSSFVWSANPSLNINGETVVNSTSTSIVDNLTNLVSTNQTVTYSIIPTSLTGNCIGLAQNVTVTVVPIPAITSTNAYTVCSGSTMSYNIISNPTNSSFSWVATNNSNVLGESTTPTTSSTINNLLTSSNTIGSELITYTITPTSTLGSCVGSPYTLFVTVNPAPVLAPNLGNNAMCVNTSTSLSNSQAGGFWSSSNTSIAAIEPTTGLISALSSGSTTITYTYANSFNCTSTANTAFTVNALPSINSPSSVSICSGGTLAYTITSDIPSTYTWVAANNMNVEGESLSPINSSVINNTVISTSISLQSISYTISPTSILGNCMGNPMNFTVTVYPLPYSPPIIGSNSICNLSLLIYNTEAISPNWQSSDVTVATISSIGELHAINPGVVTISYSVTSIYGCSDTESLMVTVNPLPQNFLSNDSICLGQVFFLELEGFNEYLWNTGSDSASIMVSPNFNQYYSVVVTDTNGCIGADTMLLSVNPVPTNPYIEGPIFLCSNALNQIISTIPSNNLLFWEVEGGDIYSGQFTNEVHINAISQDTIFVFLTEQIIATGCSSTSSFTILVDQSMTAPGYVEVTLLGTQNDFLCAPQATNIFRWGKIDKQTNDIYYYETTNQYYYFNSIDILNFYYFVDHGQSTCFTRSYYIAPPITAEITEDIETVYSLSPNPIVDAFIINSAFNELIQIQIQDIHGKVIFEGEIWTNSSFDFSTQNPGIYFVNIFSQTNKSKVKYLKL